MMIALNRTSYSWRIALLLWPLFLCNSLHAEGVPEYVMKATYLYNFMVYTQWQGHDANAPLNLCVLGRDNFGTALNTLEGKTINGAKLAINRLTNTSGVKNCNLLFVSEQEANNMEFINRQIGDAPVLTVVDTPPSGEVGIVLSLDGKRVVFDVNLRKTRLSGMSVSSKVLQLARSTSN